MRVFSAVPVAVAIFAAAPAFASAQSHVSAARKAERRGEWHRALKEWKAAYSADVNAEYLIGIGDSYAHLGNRAEAKKNYEAYLADPLALPANVTKVKAKLAALDTPSSGALALPGPGLALPGAPPPLPGLELPGASAADKGKHKKAVEPPLPLPGLDLPAAPPAQVAEKKPEPELTLPGLPLPGQAPSKKEPEKKVAAAAPPPLELPGLPLTPPPARQEPKPAVATNASPAGGKQVAMATTAKPAETHHVPEQAIAERPLRPVPQAESGGGAQKVVAFVAAGVAVAALGGGAFAFTQASSAHSDLTGKVHSGAEAQSLLESEKRNKTLSFVGFAGGLVAAGIATALFAF